MSDNEVVLNTDNDNISLSVIIPFYNTGRYLVQCLDSVLKAEITNAVEITLTTHLRSLKDMPQGIPTSGSSPHHTKDNLKQGMPELKRLKESISFSVILTTKSFLMLFPGLSGSQGRLILT